MRVQSDRTATVFSPNASQKPAAQQPLAISRGALDQFTNDSNIRKALSLIGGTQGTTLQQTSATMDPAVYPFPPGATTPQEALAKLKTIRDHFKGPPPDKVGVFAAAYVALTEQMLGRAQQYHSTNPAQEQAILAMITPFANKYFQAFAANQADLAQKAGLPVPQQVLDAQKNGTLPPVSEAWKVHFAECQNPNATAASLLGTAMNAHILSDLPVVLAGLAQKGTPGYDLGGTGPSSADSTFQKSKAGFLEYKDLFGQAADPIVTALNQYLGTNDVTIASAVAGLFGPKTGANGVTTATDYMRAQAFDLARAIRLNAITPKQIDHDVAQASATFAQKIDDSIHELGTDNVASFRNAFDAGATMLTMLIGLDGVPKELIGTEDPPPPTQTGATATPPAPK